jgi:diaminopimelate epimerase
MLRFSKAHAYGNDFLYVRSADVADVGDGQRVALARDICSRHTGVGADGLILYDRVDGEADGEATMRLLNADGSRAEVSGNGLRGLAALLLRDEGTREAAISIRTDAGLKKLTRVSRNGARQTFRASMGTPDAVKQQTLEIGGRTITAVLLSMGNPHCVILGPLPDDARFRVLGAALERHPSFAQGTNVEFVEVVSPSSVQVRIWERGVGPTTSSGTGSCAALVAAAAYGGASRDAEVVAPGGSPRVEWTDADVFLTGWAELLCDGEWLPQIPRT